MNQKQFFTLFIGIAIGAGLLFLFTSVSSFNPLASGSDYSSDSEVQSPSTRPRVEDDSEGGYSVEDVPSSSPLQPKLKSPVKFNFDDEEIDADPMDSDVGKKESPAPKDSKPASKDSSPKPKPKPSASGKCEKITNFGVVTVALGPYFVFVFPFINSVENFLFAKDPCVNVTVFLWTDHVSQLSWHKTHAASRINVLMTPRGLEPFPAASMKRFEAYLEREEELKRMDYVWHIDIDSEFIEHVGHELLVDGTFAVAHADNYYYDGSEVAGVKDNGEVLTMRDLGVVRDQPSDRAKFFKQEYVFDLANPRVIVGDPPYDGNHNARIPMDKAKYYFFGGVWGGRITEALEAFRVLRDWIRTDLAHGYMPVVHDESYVNRYFAENPPKRVLTCAFMNPVLYWTHPWLFKTFKQEGNVPLLSAHECGQRHDNEYPIVFPHGWEWPCFAATEEDRLWKPLVWNMFKCNKRPCPRKPGREWPATPADCTFCNL